MCRKRCFFDRFFGDRNQIFMIDVVIIHYPLDKISCRIIESTFFWFIWTLYNKQLYTNTARMLYKIMFNPVHPLNGVSLDRTCQYGLYAVLWSHIGTLMRHFALVPHSARRDVEGEEEENWAGVVKWSDGESAWNEKRKRKVLKSVRVSM